MAVERPHLVPPPADLEGRVIRLETLLEVHERDLVLLRPVPAALAALTTEVHAIKGLLADQAILSTAGFTDIRNLLAGNTALTAETRKVTDRLEATEQARHEAEVRGRRLRDLRLASFFRYIGGLLLSLLALVGASLYSRATTLMEGGVLWIAVALALVCMAGLLAVSFRGASLPPPPEEGHPAP